MTKTPISEFSLLSAFSLDTFLTHCDLPMALLNAEGYFVYANPAYLRFFQLSELEQQVCFFEIWRTTYPQFFSQLSVNYFEKNIKFRQEYLQISLHNPRTILPTYYHLDLKRIAQDKQHRAEIDYLLIIYPLAGWAEQVNFINQILDTEPNLIMLKNERGEITFCDQTLAEYCLVAKRDIIGKTLHDFFKTEIPPAEYLAIEQTVLESQMEIQEDERFIRHADQKEFYFHSIKRHFLYADGHKEVLCIMTDITDKKYKQQQMSHSRSLLNAVSNAIPDNIFVVDVVNTKEYKIAYANKLVFSNGYSLHEVEQLIKQVGTLQSMVFADDWQLLWATINQLYAHPYDTQSLSLRILQKTGVYHWYLLRLKVFGFSKTHHIQSVLVLLQDIHEQREREFKLQLSEQNLRESHRLANIVSWEYDLLQKEFSCSEDFFQLFGINRKREQKSIRKKPAQLLKYIHLQDKTFFDDIVWNSLKKHKKYEGEHQVTRQNDTTAYIHMIIGLEDDLQGKPIKIKGIMQDISAQKLKQTELKKQFLRTETIYHLTSHIADNLQDQIYKVLKATCNLLGMETGLILEQHHNEFCVTECFTELPKLHKGMTFKVADMICGVVSSTQKLLVIREVENSLYNDYTSRLKYNIQFYIGVPIWVSRKQYGVLTFWSSKNVAFGREDENFIRMILQWISAAIERNIFEQELIVAKEKAEKASQIKAQFLSTISHELRTPLNAVLGLSHLLLEKKPRKEQQEALKSIHFSAQNLLRLINDLLDFSKIEARKLALEQAPFSLKELIHSITYSLKPQAQAKGIKFNTLIDTQIPDILLGDSLRIGQILTNLLGNAIKFTEEGKVECSLTIDHETAQDITLFFAIKDTGIGIPIEKQQAVFEAFTQADTDTARRFGGTGLGLSITQKLLELHNSRLQLVSKVGKGTTFSFYLTLAKPYAEDHNGSFAYEKNTTPLANNRQKIHILVAEDHPTNRLILSEFLTYWQINVDFAVNGQEAIDKIQTKQYQLILMDLQMPILDGTEATRQIRSLEGDYYQKIPIIALTADVSPNIETKILQAGMNDYISKPFNPEHLLETVIRFIQQQNQHKKYQLPKDMKLAQSIFQLSQENYEFKQEFLRLNIEYLTELPTEYEQALLQGNAKLLGDIAHKAKPTIEMLGIPELATAIAEGRTAINEGNNNAELLQNIIKKVQSICQDTIKELVKEKK